MLRARDRRTPLLVPALVLVWGLFGLLQADPGQAKPDYLKRYDAGLLAIDREDWDRASDLMQKALMQRADEAKRLPQWGRWKPYVPHFYYGVARYYLDDCAQALRSFNSSEEQGVLLKCEDLYAQMLELRQECEDRGATEAKAGPGDSQEKKVRVADLAESGDRILGAAAPLATSEKDQKRFEQARTGLDVAKVTDEEVERLGELADASPSPALDRALNAYFSGDPGQALAILESFAEDDDPKAMAHVELLRAAAAHRLYLLSAKRNVSLRTRAETYARAFKASGVAVAPPKSLFGPRFLDFLASVQ